MVAPGALTAAPQGAGIPSVMWPAVLMKLVHTWNALKSRLTQATTWLIMVLTTSHLVNNPDRLCLKCPKRTCKFFQWINQPPRGLAKEILVNRERQSFFQRNLMQDLVFTLLFVGVVLFFLLFTILVNGCEDYRPSQSFDASLPDLLGWTIHNKIWPSL